MQMQGFEIVVPKDRVHSYSGLRTSYNNDKSECIENPLMIHRSNMIL